jgi:O-succinylbenzoic acid--CoA ligase
MSLANLFLKLRDSRDPRLLLNPLISESFPKESFYEWWKKHPHYQSLYFFLSSGSEGDIKAFGLSERALLSSAYYVNEHLSARASDTWLLALPTFHLGGFSLFPRAYLSGSKILPFPQNKWDVEIFAQFCATQNASLISLVPAQVYDLVSKKISAPACVRAVFVGGSALNPILLRAARELGWPLLPTFGMTEACSQIATHPLARAREEGSESIFEILPHWKASTNAEGQLSIRGPSLFNVALVIKNGEIGAMREFEDGDTYTSSDVVELSQAGKRPSLRFLDRASQRIKIGGEWTQIGRLSDILESILVESSLDPSNFCIANLPDERLGEKIVLVVAGSQAPNTVERVSSHFNSRVLGFEKIREVHDLPAIPRTSIGKVSRAELGSLLRSPR